MTNAVVTNPPIAIKPIGRKAKIIGAVECGSRTDCDGLAGST